MKVRLTTTLGDIVLDLDSANAPGTASNFVEYVRDGFYDGTLFHRVIEDFMIQGGGFEADMKSKQPRSTIHNEADNRLSNATGTVAMARSSDPHSASCQFFINASDNVFLDFKAPTPEGWGYCVFGSVIEGMDVVTRLNQVATTSRSGHQNVPIEDVRIEKAEVLD
jgi:peptidyl-prolyl cis-trans isomerase B (cyclophilin B)